MDGRENPEAEEKKVYENKKKKYSVDELLIYAYKHNQIPEILFVKDRDC